MLRIDDSDPMQPIGVCILSDASNCSKIFNEIYANFILEKGIL